MVCIKYKGEIDYINSLLNAGYTIYDIFEIAKSKTWLDKVNEYLKCLKK